jgi:hypothetical protein
VLTEGGFAIERLSFTNMTTFPILLAVRSFDRLTGRTVKEASTDLSIPPAPVNLAFDAAMRAESAILKRTNLPIGSSIVCVARKPN